MEDAIKHKKVVERDYSNLSLKERKLDEKETEYFRRINRTSIYKKGDNSDADIQKRKKKLKDAEDNYLKEFREFNDVI